MTAAIEPTPDSIRRMRKELGWTQAQAGREIGGGPSAFQKYESGAAKPSRAAFRLLCLLHGQKAREAAAVPAFMQVGSKDMKRLASSDLESLLARLIGEEICRSRLPADSLQPRPPANAADGGIDMRIVVPAGSCRPQILPAADVAFQCKARGMGPKECTRELTAGKDGRLRPLILQVLEGGGAYVILCSQQVGKDGIEKRVEAMRATLRRERPDVDEGTLGRLLFWDGQKIASWANRHAGICQWLHGLLGHADRSCLESLQQLAGRREHCGSHCSDRRAEQFARQLHEHLALPRAAVRIAGAAGVGRTRLLLETLRADPSCRNALYADLAAPIDEARLFDHVREICRSRMHALVVIDNCPTSGIRGFAALATHADSSARMILVDDGHEEPVGNVATIRVERADEGLIAGMLQQMLPPDADPGASTKAAEGFPRMAALIAEAGKASPDRIDPGSIVDADSCCRILAGRRECPEQLQIAARLLSLVTSVGCSGPARAELESLANLRPDISRDQLHESIEFLRQRGLLRTAGERMALIPPPLAWKLAKQQWNAWPDEKLARLCMKGGIAASLRPRLLRRFLDTFVPSRDASARNDVKATRKVELLLAAMIGDERELDGLLLGDSPQDHWLRGSLAEFIPGALVAAVHDRMEAAGSGLVRKLAQSRCWPGILRRAIEADPECLQPAGRLLFDLAIAEMSCRGGNCEGQARNAFVGLFGSALPDRNSNRQTRLLDELLGKCAGGPQAEMVAAALGAPFASPAAAGDLSGQLLRDHCMGRLAGLAASRRQAVADPARRQFARRLRAMLGCQQVSDVVGAIEGIAGRGKGGYWPEALEQINAAIRLDWQDDARARQQLELLRERIMPKTPAERADFYATRQFFTGTDPGRRGDCCQDADRQLEQVADEIAPRWHEHQDLLSGIIASPHSRAAALARRLYIQVDDGRQLVECVTAMVERLLEDGKPVCPSFLSGILEAMHERPGEADELLARLAATKGLQRHFVQFLQSCGRIDGSRLELLAGCIKASPDELADSAILLTSQSLQGVSNRDAASFVCRILGDVPQGSAVAFCTEFLHSFAARQNESIERLAGAVHALIARLTPEFWDQRGQPDGLHDLSNMVLVFAGRDGKVSAATAVKTAAAVVQVLIDNIKDGNVQCLCRDWFFRGLLDELLEGFPDTVWPPLGNCICQAPENAMPWLKLFARGWLLQKLPTETLISWCDSSSRARRFAFGTLPLLQAGADGSPAAELNPLMLRLIKRHDNAPDVYDQIDPTHFRSPLVGRLSDHFRKFPAILRELAGDGGLPPNFRMWAREKERGIVGKIEGMSRQEERENIDCWNIR